MNFIDLNEDNKDYTLSYLTFNSNYRLLGSSEEEKIELEYEKFGGFMNSTKNTVDISSFKSIQSNYDFDSFDKQFIYVSYHFGPYKTLINYLCDKGIDLILLVGSEYYNDESAKISELHRLKSSKTKIGNLIILDIGIKSSFLEIRKRIKNGYSLFTFLDGNNSKSDTSNEDNFERIDFFNTSIWMKKGIIRLSHTFDIPINLILCTSEENKLNVSITEFGKSSKMQNIFDEFYSHLLKTPYQWECWLYCNNWYENKITENVFEPDILSDSDYQLIKFKTRYFAYVFNSLEYYEIGIEEFQRLT